MVTPHVITEIVPAGGCDCNAERGARPAGQTLGIKEAGGGIWLVSFITCDLGYTGLEQKTLQTIGNPLGTRVSPLS